MRPNHLRQLLNAGKPSIGTHVMVSWPAIIEVAGYTEMIDYVEFVAEYAPYDLYSMENMGRAFDLFKNMSSMIKVEQDHREFVATRGIGSGIQNVLFSDVRSAEEAKKCVATVRAETPQTGGRYGATNRRFSGYVGETWDSLAGGVEYVQALEDVVIALMIEKESAVEELESILDVDGIDMVQFGPGDYSMSIGKPGQMNDSKVLEAEEYVIKTALRKNVQPRAEITSPEEAERYLKMGVNHYSIGTDLHVFYQYLKTNAKALRSIIGS